MSAPLFLASREELLGSQVVLSGPEGHHAADVRRLVLGERVDLSDGAGLVVACSVASVRRGEVVLDVVSRHEEPAPVPRVVVVQALPKGERADIAIELMTEVGVDEIVPWAASRCVAEWRGSERITRGVERWRAVAREASKQARRAWIPIVTSLASTADVIARMSAASNPVVLHADGMAPLSWVKLPEDGEAVVVIGPEGGLTEQELSAFTAAGATTCRVGPHVLRTSTAGAVAGALLLAGTRRWA